MARNVANVDITVETFGAWVTRTNTLLDALSNEIITANSSWANTGVPASQRNAQLYGTFVANTFVVATELKGGSNTSSFANLAITSNVVFTGAAVNVASNTTFTGSNTNIGGTILTITSNNIAVSVNAISVTSNTQSFKSNSSVTAISIVGNSSATNTTIGGTILNITPATSIANTLTINTDYVVDVSANSDIGTNAVARLIYSFPKDTYRTGKLTIMASKTGNNQIAEMLVAHDNTNAYLTVYGTVSSPSSGGTTAPLGTFVATINNANVEISMNQVLNNSAVKIVAHLIK